LQIDGGGSGGLGTTAGVPGRRPAGRRTTVPKPPPGGFCDGRTLAANRRLGPGGAAT